MIEREHQIRASARALLPLIEGYNASGEDQALKNLFYKLIYLGCRHIEFFCVPHVSAMADGAAKKKGIDDLSKCDWSKIQKMKLLKEFHLDHVIPVSVLAKELIAMDDPSEEKVFNCINRTEVAWILKNENSRLPKNKRKANPWETYFEKKVLLR